MQKCNKCDERGMINDSKIEGIWSGHSCKCGYNNFLAEKNLKNINSIPSEFERSVMWKKLVESK